MSYNIIDENMLNDQKTSGQIEAQQPVKKIRDHRDFRNPHYNKPHRPEAKAAISATQKARYDLLRTAVEKANNQISESRVREIVRETLDDYLRNHAIPADNNNQKTIDIRL